jgi:hypothetical protein
MNNSMWRQAFVRMRPAGLLSTSLVLAVSIFAGERTLAAQADSHPPSSAVVPKSAPIPASTPKLVFRRIFKSSSPEYIEIVVPEDSHTATYDIRQLEEDPEATPFEITAGLKARMFEMASQLNNFRGQDLDVHRKIANLGEKTFRWEKGAEANEVKFNYTLNSTATQLLQIFEGLARQQEHVMLLTRRMRYDRLGINDALLQFETDLNHKLLPEPQSALPMLDEIVNDSRFVDVARARARNLADRIRRSS